MITMRVLLALTRGGAIAPQSIAKRSPCRVFGRTRLSHPTQWSREATPRRGAKLSLTGRACFDPTASLRTNPAQAGSAFSKITLPLSDGLPKKGALPPLGLSNRGRS